MKITFIVLHLLISFGLMAVVLFQSSKSQGLSGSIAGGAETFFGKNKGKTMDGVLAKITVALAILFVVTSVTLTVLDRNAVNNTAPDEQVEDIDRTELSGEDTESEEEPLDAQNIDGEATEANEDGAED